MGLFLERNFLRFPQTREVSWCLGHVQDMPGGQRASGPAWGHLVPVGGSAVFAADGMRVRRSCSSISLSAAWFLDVFHRRKE